MPSHPHYFKQWGAGGLTECKTPIIFSSYVLPGSDVLLRTASAENSGKEELYVVCPQYANGKGELTDTQYTVTGKATMNEGETLEEIATNGAKREVAEETGLEIDNIGRPIAYRMAGKKGNKAVSVHSFYYRILPNTQLNKITTPSIEMDDPTKKIQVLLTGQKEILLEIMTKNLVPRPSGDTVKPSDPNGSYICGVRLIALNDILEVFFDAQKQQTPVLDITRKKFATGAKKNSQKEGTKYS